MSQYGKTPKNPPWVRSGQGNQVPQSLITHQIPQIPNPPMLQYPQVYQGQMAQQMYGSVGAVSYPTRALNSAAFAGGSVNQPSGGGTGVNNSSGVQHQNSGPPQQHQGNTGMGGGGGQSGGPKQQRVFTGIVTKVQDNFGFVDDDVFFQTSCCVKGISPQVGDKVLVEAVYNSNMPFKWNATRIQVLSVVRGDVHNQRGGAGGTYNAVPPPNEMPPMGAGVGSGGGGRFNSGSGGSRFSNNDRGRGEGPRRDRPPMRNRSDEMEDRKRRRDDNRDREEKEKDRVCCSPPRKRSKSPPRQVRRPPARRPPPRYSVIVPKISLASLEGDVVELRKRYLNLYIPSDFFLTKFNWTQTFPAGKPLSLNFPCSFHIFHKDVDPIIENNAILEPPDSDYLFSAKVMLLSSPGLEELYSKCGACGDHQEREGSGSTADDDGISSSSSQPSSHPSRLIQFLVGTRGKEFMAIGGPWSPSLDGANPQEDPGVLVRTAMRTCKALTGIDLNQCTQWFRFLEVHYHRGETLRRGKLIPARVETVVLFVPDIWSVCPTRLDWEDNIQSDYKKALVNRLSPGKRDDLLEQTSSSENQLKDDNEGSNSGTPSTPEKCLTVEVRKEPKHFSELDPKNMKVIELREELEARCLSPRGIKSQLAARLAKVIKTEAEGEKGKKSTEEPAVSEANSPSPSVNTIKKDVAEEKKKKEEDEKRKLDDREKALLEKRYKLPENPHIIVHPNRSAKAGKFDCSIVSLSSLLGYRQEDTKEHSFEVSLFAELFNEMLMRDFGFHIYRCILDAPEKQKEDDKDKKKEREKNKDNENKDDKGTKDKEGKDNEKTKKDNDEKKVEEFEEGSLDAEEKKDKRPKKDESLEKKREEKNVKVIDPHFVLSFIYFDTNRCGYVHDKDLEDLLFSLGISLSRSQIKKIVQKVTTRDVFYYRKFTEKPKDDLNQEIKVESQDIYLQGNKRFLVSKSTDDGSNNEINVNAKTGGESSKFDSGFVMFNGSLIDVSKLLDQLNKSEITRIDTEKSLAKLKSEFNKLKENSQKSERHIKDLMGDVRDYKERLSNTNSELCSLEAKQRIYYLAINDINDRIKPLIKPTTSNHSPCEVVVIDVKSRKGGSSVRSAGQTSSVSGSNPNISTLAPGGNKEKEPEIMEIVEITDDGGKVNDDDAPLVKKLRREENEDDK